MSNTENSILPRSIIRLDSFCEQYLILCSPGDAGRGLRTETIPEMPMTMMKQGLRLVLASAKLHVSGSSVRAGIVERLKSHGSLVETRVHRDTRLPAALVKILQDRF